MGASLVTPMLGVRVCRGHCGRRGEDVDQDPPNGYDTKDYSED